MLNVKIAAKRPIATDICLLELSSVSGEPLPSFSAGAHIDVHVSNGVVRQYSLCNAVGQDHRYLIAVLREPESRGGSSAIHDKLGVGDVIEISEPRNNFPLAKPGDKVLLLAGGIGITPLLCMAGRLHQSRAPFELHYCARSIDRMAFREYLATCDYREQVHFHFDDGDENQRLNLEKVLPALGSKSDIYVCGPSGFIDWALKAAQAGGIPSDRLHREYFSAPPVASGPNDAFEIVVASTGQTLTVPADRSAANVLIEAGVPLAVSCEEGICGSCITGVLEGIPDHRDAVFTDEEREGGDRFTPCCSRAKSARLVLDL
nr:PDR/VanB family oxidoreductase [Bradyrhizobium sp. CCBAU 53338]